MQLLANLKKAFSPNLSLLLVDRNGIIRDAYLYPENAIVYSCKDVLGKQLKDIFRPLRFSTDRYLDLARIPENVACPLDLYVQVRHRFASGERNTFHYSFSSWFPIGKRTYSIISLTPHTSNSPLVQKLLTLYRSENVPTIILDARFRIVSYNHHFHEILNFVDDDTFSEKPIIPLLKHEFQDPNPFLRMPKIKHIREVALRKGLPWETAFDFFEKGVPKSPEAAGLRANHSVLMTRLENAILVSQAPGPLLPMNRYSLPVLTSIRGFNNAEQDIEIIMKINGKRSGTITLVPGHPLTSNKHLFKFDAAYHIDIDVWERISITLWRRSAPLFSCTLKTVLPEITFKRIGAYFELYCNGKRLFTYADPRPLFNNFATHLSLYVWSGEFEMHALSVKTRPTTFSVEEMEEKDPQIVAFSNAPDKLYKFVAEPVSYCGVDSALAVRFFPVPVFMHKSKKDYYLSLFEGAREYIQKNYFRSIDYQSLARQCCVSHKHFIKKFKNLFGLSPKAYQTDIRLKEAQILLKSNRMKVVEVAETVGIDDPKNFQKMFKKRFKCAPGEFSRGKLKMVNTVKHR